MAERGVDGGPPQADRQSPIRRQELTVAAELVAEGQDTLGEAAPDIILVDRGLISGPLFAHWKKNEPSDQWGFLTTLDIRSRQQALNIYRHYDDRSLIENKAPDQVGGETGF